MGIGPEAAHLPPLRAVKLLTPRLPFRDTPDPDEVDRDRDREPEALEHGHEGLQPDHGLAPGDEQLIDLEVPDFACASCGAGMDAGQDWCLECGTAAPGRIDERPGGRAALTIASIVVVLVLSAGVAAYAALSSDAARETQGTDPNGQPLQAQVPPPPGPGAATNTPPPADVPTPLPEGGTGDGAQIPTPLPDAGGATGAPATAPGAPSGGGDGPSAAPSGGGGGSSGGSGGAPATRPVGAIALAPGSGDVQFLNEGERRADSRFGDPTKAYDGSDARVWQASVPADGDDFGLGLAFGLERPRDMSSVTLNLDGRGGFGVEVFGSAGRTQPPDMLDRRWKKIGSDSDVRDGQRISLDADGRVRHLLVRITEAPQGAEGRRSVAIAEVRFRGR